MNAVRFLPYLGTAAAAFLLGQWQPWHVSPSKASRTRSKRTPPLSPAPLHPASIGGLPENGVLRLRSQREKEAGELVLVGSPQMLTVTFHDPVTLPLILFIPAHQAASVWSILRSPEGVHATFEGSHGSLKLWGMGANTLYIALEEKLPGSQTKREVDLRVSGEDLQEAWQTARGCEEEAAVPEAPAQATAKVIPSDLSLVEEW